MTRTHNEGKEEMRAAHRLLLVVLLATVPLFSELPAYPLDGAELTGIKRLVGYHNKQESGRGRLLPPGALLSTDDIRLHLQQEGTEWDLTGVEKDADLQAAIESIFRRRHSSYAVAVVDITDPKRIAWAGLREDATQSPGSVGKVLVMTALFDGLRRAFPDPADRRRVLKEHVITAGDWIIHDSHKVPLFDEASGRNRFRPPRIGDRFTLAEWIDHMVSPSANAAASTVWKEAMLLRHFGAAYPVTPEQEKAFFKETPRTALGELSVAVINDPLLEVGIDLAHIQQGSFFTRVGKSKVPGRRSFASPKELVRLLLRMEQGRLVDAWSSLEMKRYLYLTKKRYRYVYPPELKDAAVYFKSGSLYKCSGDPGSTCGKYRGDVWNYMNSIAIVESPARAGANQRRYLVALLSNVLQKNSAWDHSRLGAAIDQALHTRKETLVKEAGSKGQISDAGKSH